MTPEALETLVREWLPGAHRSGKEIRGFTDPFSRSRSHISVNLQKQVFFDFHTNTGGHINQLLRELGAPIPKELGGNGFPQALPQWMFGLLKAHRNLARSGYRCGQATGIKKKGNEKVIAHRVVCLRWHCPACAVRLRAYWKWQLTSIVIGAVFQIDPIFHKSLTRILDKTKRKFKRFEWLLLQAGEEGWLLFVHGDSNPEVLEHLKGQGFTLVQLYDTT